MNDLGEYQTQDTFGLWHLYGMDNGHLQFRRLDQVLEKDDLLAMLKMLEEVQGE